MAEPHRRLAAPERPGRRALLAGTIWITCLSSPASAQLWCSARTTPAPVPSKSQDALLGDIVLNCRAVGDASSGGPYLIANISVEISIGLTNELDGAGGLPLTNALLLVNENPSEDPASTSEIAVLGGDCDAPNEYFPCPQRGVKTRDTRLEWNGVRLPIPGPNALSPQPFPPITTVRITGIRGRVADLGIPDQQQFPPVQVQAYLALTTGLAVDRNLLNIAVPIPPTTTPPPPPPALLRPHTLLYPFVTNQAGFDTGVLISNTSLDPFDTKPRTGPCLLNFVGESSDGMPVAITRVTRNVPPGSAMTFTLSGGNPDFNILPVPGFRGYLFAVCRFPFAHGYAAVIDGFNGLPQLVQGYLPLSIPAAAAVAGQTKSLAH